MQVKIVVCFVVRERVTCALFHHAYEANDFFIGELN